MIRFMHLQADRSIADRLIGCDRKIRYDQQFMADRARKVMARKRRAGDGRRLESYLCEHCEGWHIGHERRSS